MDNAGQMQAKFKELTLNVSRWLDAWWRGEERRGEVQMILTRSYTSLKSKSIMASSITPPLNNISTTTIKRILAF